LRFAPLLGLVALATACQRAPSPPLPTADTAVIESEPLNGPEFNGCNYYLTPLLVITSDSVILDGTPVDREKLHSALENKQALNAQLGLPEMTEIAVQVTQGVSERRVARSLAIARDVGFTNVTRFTIPVLPETRRKISHGAKR
jgi:hypothetical protein